MSGSEFVRRWSVPGCCRREDYPARMLSLPRKPRLANGAAAPGGIDSTPARTVLTGPEETGGLETAVPRIPFVSLMRPVVGHEPLRQLMG